MIPQLRAAQEIIEDKHQKIYAMIFVPSGPSVEAPEFNFSKTSSLLPAIAVVGSNNPIRSNVINLLVII